MHRLSPVIGRIRFLSVLFLLLVPAGAAAQSAYPSGYLPADHWTGPVVRRLIGLGLAPRGIDPTSRFRSQREVGAALEHATRVAEDSAQATQVAGWLERYRGEVALEGGGLTALVAGSDARAGYAHRTGAREPGSGYEDGHFYGDWTPGPARPDRGSAFLESALQLNVHPAVAVRAAGLIEDGDAELVQAYAAARVGPLAIWAGRRSIGWAPGARSGIVLSEATLDGAGLHTDRPLVLPWFLRHVGPVRFEVDAAQVDLTHSCQDPHLAAERRPCDDAWLLATRGSVEPHPRFSLGVTRAVFFGGDGNTGVDAFAFFSILIGKHAGEVSELDNQVVSVNASYRPPVERWLPLRLYAEWGFEDSAGAWYNVPGVLAGVEIPSVPGAERLLVGAEAAAFSPSCCANPIWYRHSVFHDGWALDGRPLGHPLGGHGSEGRLFATFSAGALQLSASAFVRRRGDENQFAPVREGDARGGTLRFTWAFEEALELHGQGEVEDGAGWREVHASVSFRAFP